LAALLDAEPVDLAHIHNIYHQISPSILPLLKQRGLPVIMTLHDWKLICPNYRLYRQGKICEACKGQRYYQAVAKKCVMESRAASLLNCLEAYLHHRLRIYESNVDYFICPSEFMKHKMAEHGLPENKLRVIHNGVEVQTFRSSSDDCGFILYFGNLTEEKGVFTLLEAARFLKTKEIVVTGTGPAALPLREKAAHLGIKNIRFLGFVPEETLVATLRGASFTVIPSQWYENFPSSVLESMAYGKPVIGSRIGGIPEQVEDGVNGLLFEPGNAVDLAEKINYLAARPSLVREMGYNARRTVKTKYSMDRHYEQVMALYNEARMQHTKLTKKLQ
jgi:glycosyltransferase involved in cell wall biosynthesis